MVKIDFFVLNKNIKKALFFEIQTVCKYNNTFFFLPFIWFLVNLIQMGTCVYIVI